MGEGSKPSGRLAGEYGSDWDRRQAAVRTAPDLSWPPRNAGVREAVRPENRTTPLVTGPSAGPAAIPAAGPLDAPRYPAPRYSTRTEREEMPSRAPAPPQAGAARGAAPGTKIAGNRLLVVMLFWGMLATSVALWAFGTPPSELDTQAEIITAAGRVTGLVGGFLLLVQILMMSRVAWLETWVGGHDLMRWHRRMGAWLLVMVLAHAGYITAGYALTENATIADETVTLFTTYDDMVGAFTAVGIMVALSAMAIRGLRRRLPYELWHLLHLATYAVLILGYGHQFSNGAELADQGFGRWYWTGLYALVIACLAWGRIVEPLWLNLRHRFEVIDVVPESDSMFSIYIGGRRLDRIEARAGQYFRWRFLTGGGWWQSHPFSLSAAPNRQWLRLTVSQVGGHTNQLRELRPGTRLLAAGPSGTFTAAHRLRRKTLLIAGGSGIAPIRALLDELPGGSVVIYRASDAGGIVFGDELRALAQRRGIELRYVLGSRDEAGPRRLFTPEGLRELVPDVRHRDVYLCGPAGMVEAAIATLRRLRVRRRQIHLDPFEF
jgi:predicted ferric reductase